MTRSTSPVKDIHKAQNQMTLFSTITPGQKQALKGWHILLLCIITPVIIGLIGFLIDILITTPLEQQFRFNPLYERLRVMVQLLYLLTPLPPLCLGIAWPLIARLKRNKQLPFQQFLITMMVATFLIFCLQVYVIGLTLGIFFDLPSPLFIFTLPRLDMIAASVSILILTNILLFWIFLKSIIRRTWNADHNIDQVFK